MSLIIKYDSQKQSQVYLNFKGFYLKNKTKQNILQFNLMNHIDIIIMVIMSAFVSVPGNY